jgi:ESCRT-II complex subunit VPS36
MDKTRELVQMAESYTTKLAKKTGGEESDTSEFESYVMSLGIDLPVTRAAFGNGDRFHKELARELAGFLLKPLEDAKGLMVLTDVYCLVNRARGVEMVSPDDIYKACSLFESLQLPLRLGKFSNGVLVVKLASKSDEEYTREVLACVKGHCCLSASQLAQLKSFSLTLAQQLLLAAESQGVLCRDETVEALVFYPNRFLLSAP